MSTLGSQQFLYPAKPYNEITPGGISSEQSLAMMNAASQRRAQFALQSNEQKHATQMQRERLDFETSQAEDDRNFQREIEERAARARQISDQRRLLNTRAESDLITMDDEERRRIEELDLAQDEELKKNEAQLTSLMILRAFRDQGVSGEAWTQVMKGLADKGSAADAVYKALIDQKDDLFGSLESPEQAPVDVVPDSQLKTAAKTAANVVLGTTIPTFSVEENKQQEPKLNPAKWDRIAREVVLAAGGSNGTPGSVQSDQLTADVASLLAMTESSLAAPAPGKASTIKSKWMEISRSMNAEQLASALAVLKQVSGADVANKAKAALGAQMKAEKGQPAPMEGDTAVAAAAKGRKLFNDVVFALQGLTDDSGKRLAEWRLPGGATAEQEVVKNVLTGIFTNLTSTKSLQEAIDAMMTEDTRDDPTYLQGWEKVKDPAVREYLVTHLRQQQAQLLRLEQETGMTLETTPLQLREQKERAVQGKMSERERVKGEFAKSRSDVRSKSLSAQEELLRQMPGPW